MIKITPYYSSSEGNLYTVKNENTKILLECGVQKVRIITSLTKNKENVRSYDACLISHAHSDHSQSIEYVNQYIPVYANERVFDKYPFKGTIIEHRKSFTIGTIKILPIKVEHGEMLNFAYIFKDNNSLIFWGTDFSNIPVDKLNFSFDEIWIECNYVPVLLNSALEESKEDASKNFCCTKYERQMTTHMSLDNLIYILNNKFILNKCTKIVGLHISQDVGDYDLMYSKIKKEFTKIKIQLLRKDGNIYGDV